MAKTQKYSEDQLLEAVVKFSEIEKRKIKATELAKWCRDNIKGLEEVRDYHFTRPIKEKDKVTGKTKERAKLCTLKIEEINKARSIMVKVNTNLLLRASNIDTFMEQPESAKRKMIVETRETVDKLIARNGSIERENEALKVQNRYLQSNIMGIQDKIDTLQKAQEKLNRQVSYLMKATDEATRKEMLSQMGIEDGSVDLGRYMKSLEQELDEVVDINATLRKHFIDTDTKNSEEKTNTLTEDILSGLDF